MNGLDSMLERNRSFVARQSAGDTHAFASAGAAKCEGDHHRLR
jgi:hypothetical protein